MASQIRGDKQLNLTVLPEELSVVRYAVEAIVPKWIFQSGSFWNIMKICDELSVVCETSKIPTDETYVKIESGFRAIKVEGPLDFALTGILSELIRPLAAHEISIFALSTYDTDYILVKDVTLERTVELFRADGHQID